MQRSFEGVVYGPVTLLRIETAHEVAGGRLGIGCIRFKYGRIPWYTQAYGEAEIFFSEHAEAFCAYSEV